MKRLTIIFGLITISITYAQTVSFMAIGDWGREGKYGQQETANQMGLFAENNKINFILTLGDNIYEDGVTSTTDPKWQTCFENVYSAKSLQIPWYVTLGNHDYYGNVQAQIDYSNISTRWKCPASYYTFEKIIDDTTFVLFVIIDTYPLEVNYKYINPSTEGMYRGAAFDIKKQETKRQLKWIDSVLSTSTAKWKIVAGHHPIHSGGEHGNTTEIIELVLPILEKYKVNMYLCGHDHDMQYLKKPGSSVHQFVSGAGSRLRNTGKMEYTIFSHSENGFLAVSLKNNEITASFISAAGTTLYNTIIK